MSHVSLEPTFEVLQKILLGFDVNIMSAKAKTVNKRQGTSLAL